MGYIVKRDHWNINEGLTVLQFKDKLFDQGFSISKEHIIGIIKKRKMREEGLVSMQKFYTEKGMRTGYIIRPEGIRIITLEIKCREKMKIFHDRLP